MQFVFLQEANNISNIFFFFHLISKVSKIAAATHDIKLVDFLSSVKIYFSFPENIVF